MAEIVYRTLYEIEKTHRWCRARDPIVEDVIDRWIRLPAAGNSRN